MNVPKLRFKDDDGREFPEWRNVRFGNIDTFSKGKGISKADIAPDGITPCIREVDPIFWTGVLGAISRYIRAYMKDRKLSFSG